MKGIYLVTALIAAVTAVPIRIAEGRIDIEPRDFFEQFWADDAPFSFAKYYHNAGYEEVDDEPWAPEGTRELRLTRSKDMFAYLKAPTVVRD